MHQIKTKHTTSIELYVILVGKLNNFTGFFIDFVDTTLNTLYLCILLYFMTLVVL